MYPASGRLSSRQIKQIILPVLDHLDGLVGEFYDESFLKENDLIGRKDAFAWIHMPPDERKLDQAKRRLKYDELFLMQLGLALRRYRTQHSASATPCMMSDEIDSRIRRRFPFLLTDDQNACIAEIAEDMGRTTPMNRLLQGDVGSGKTVVALYAALLAIANKTQAAIMAPTEILASQHFLSMERYLKDSQVRRVLITGGMTGKKRDEVLAQIRLGEIDIVVGTVALLQKDIEFRHLGLVVIDEQHKFGVHQRAELRKASAPHCLVMTATPIPRTLAMTAFGDLDVSVIKQCPPGRGAVVTRWVDPKDRPKAYEFIRERLRAKKQAYFVCPRITAVEETGKDIKAATDTWKELSERVFPEFQVALLHGQMPSAEKQRIMTGFRKGEIDVLVSTVVIEVGVDVPNATIMVIEEADRFGLAQLHQLRGRIGRGESKSYCLLFAETDNEVARSRLDVMTRTNDGFEIAEQDLRIRGPGETVQRPPARAARSEDRQHHRRLRSARDRPEARLPGGLGGPDAGPAGASQHPPGADHQVRQLPRPGRCRLTSGARGLRPPGHGVHAVPCARSQPVQTRFCWNLADKRGKKGRCLAGRIDAL